MSWVQVEERGRAMVVAGVMSGTSADGVDVAVCRIGAGIADAARPEVEVMGHTAVPYPAAVREAVLGAMDARAISVAELSRLSWRLGSLYADAVERAAKEASVRVELVGCHGQTAFHEAGGVEFLGETVRSTWQMGEAAVVAERLRCPVVSDFRPADVAAGGQGAPLVPMLDALLFRSATVPRVLVNLGGIANVTAMGVGDGAVVAFDTGPGNMVVDALMRGLYGREFDAEGAVAASGRVLEDVVREALGAGYFERAPPKSCGREQFGVGYANGLLERCREAGGSDADAVATATALTARSLAGAYARFVAPAWAGERDVEWVLAGGGVRNGTMLRMLEAELVGRGVRLRRVEEFGVAAEAKEAVAFALLAWLTWQGRPGNVPAATRAGRPVVLGKVCFG